MKSLYVMKICWNVVTFSYNKVIIHIIKKDITNKDRQNPENGASGRNANGQFGSRDPSSNAK